MKPIFDVSSFSILILLYKELNNSETAFMMPSDDPDDYDVHLRFFTPTSEVPICGHATIDDDKNQYAKKKLTIHRSVQSVYGFLFCGFYAF
ncbi:MAG: PhzF family phenazine biosynthesis protein [Sporolactobacillus sp.]